MSPTPPETASPAGASPAASPRHVDLYWDTGSTNSYFALKLIEPVLARTGATLALHPFNLGHVFRLHNYVLMDEPPAKIANRIRDLHRWAARHRLPFRMPEVFPIKTSRSLRGSLVMRRHGLEQAYVREVMAAYWERNDASIADYAGLAPIVRALGVDPRDFEAECESAGIRAALADHTDRALARGVFGVPMMAVGEELFWGKDRMDFVEEALMRLPAAGSGDADARPATGTAPGPGAPR
jgi:2-hydroxychromene-2-carboxylate isomerase